MMTTRTVLVTDDFHMVVDMCNLNKIVVVLFHALPKLDTVVHHLAGSTCFAKGDKVHGYWQVDVEEESRKYTAFDSPVGPHEHCGMPMGFINAGPWFQKCFEGILAPMLYKKLLQYLDDSLLHSKGESNLLDSLDQYFGILHKHNVKLHPSKFVLFAKALTWCGKQVSERGLRPSPERVATVNAMPEPEGLSEMMRLVKNKK